MLRYNWKCSTFCCVRSRTTISFMLNRCRHKEITNWLESQKLLLKFAHDASAFGAFVRLWQSFAEMCAVGQFLIASKEFRGKNRNARKIQINFHSCWWEFRWQPQMSVNDAIKLKWKGSMIVFFIAEMKREARGHDEVQKYRSHFSFPSWNLFSSDVRS